MKNFNVVIISAVVALSFLSAPKAKAEMSQGAVQTAQACVYMGAVTAAGAAVILEKSAVKYGLLACAAAGGATAAGNYLVIPANADEAPAEADLQSEPAQPNSEE